MKNKNFNNFLKLLCMIFIPEDEIRLLERLGFPQEKCINYLNPDEAHEEMRAAWQNRKLFF